MSLGCVRWVLSRTVRSVCASSPAYRTPTLRLTICSERYNIAASSWRCSTLCMAVDDTEQTPAPKKKRANAQISSVGRKIPHRQIQVISDTGENMGTMHRADVIRIMDDKGLKLVLLSDQEDPPVYRLMSGKQIHEEQLKQREKQKGKAAPVQLKELNLSSTIAAHDLSTKLKQVEGLLEKKHHDLISSLQFMFSGLRFFFTFNTFSLHKIRHHIFSDSNFYLCSGVRGMTLTEKGMGPMGKTKKNKTKAQQTVIS
ncbi:translation initiation factor IF-3%2C mitochondrial [Xyrichtys novacula]|uniref:Translation initiation factor IF-3, mitochondrial n=1 Tax=Xyrichtys novacula TaxID=13765 RepID=A0AAV1GXS0_XYRNO|nr:translation initiation factor IF-3%2C mitochondrial [Xyrichtys novacula]